MTEEEGRQFEAEDAGRRLSRRDFLQVLSASFAALSASGCGLRPPKDAIVSRFGSPEEGAAGLETWYTSTCSACSAGCGVLMKSRDGRPIKAEGNPDHPISLGGLCARGQASILDLYDSHRLKSPLIGGAPASWAAVDVAVGAGLASAKHAGRGIRILSRTIISPSLRAAIDAFIAAHPGAKHIVYDPVGAEAIVEAHRRTHGLAVLPRYHFDRARVIVSFDADFLGSWISPVEHARGWAAGRTPDADFEFMSWHAQFESRLTTTGSVADLRVPLPPEELAAAAAAVGRAVAKERGWNGPLPSLPPPADIDASVIAQTAEMLVSARGHSLAVSGSDDPSVQVIVNWINEMIGAYGATVDLARPSFQREGRAGALEALIAEMAAGAVGALVVLDANPAHEHARATEFVSASKKVGFIVDCAERPDETSALAHVVAATPHALETWGDAEPAAGIASLAQPLLSPLFDSRPALESLLIWAHRPATARDHVRSIWQARFYHHAKGAPSFETFWEDTLRLGAFAFEVHPVLPGTFAATALVSTPSRRSAGPGLAFIPYASIALGDGRQANNPWLQELPDPITKVTWGNVACFSREDAAGLGIEDGRMVRLSALDRFIELPAVIVPGQARGTVAAALGHGRSAAGPIAANFPLVKLLGIDRDPGGGADAYPFARVDRVAVGVLPETVTLAKTQIFDSQTVPFTGQKREILRESTLQDYFKDSENGPAAESEVGMWPVRAYEGRKWGMSIDLNACTGCSACVIACQAENNVPVVGKAEVAKGREMSWIRIDRYFGDEAESPDAAFQPMLCQHCDDAPCETVCPVIATAHSEEGLNMQVYNRCVGTRYCANNCPYKVRRFNWFDYAHQDLIQNLALNPDVTVRTRGVMEKCSFCTQRIYSAKSRSSSEGRELRDGDVTPACAQSCPAQAIVFGDLNDPESRVAKAVKRGGSYKALAELGVGPAVTYGTKVRNRRVRRTA